MNDITYDVRIYKTETCKGAKVVTYKVRWKVGTRVLKKSFRVAAQADAYRSELLTAARKGEAFHESTGEPVAWRRTENDQTWYDFACAYVDMKWKDSSGGYRRDIARALMSATPAMIETSRGKPGDAAIRRALTRWGFNSRKRNDCPNETAEILRWLSRNTKPMSSLTEAARVRALLDAATTRLDGTRNAASTVMRNRAILYNAFEYAVELRTLTENPLKTVKWKSPKKAHEVDRRCVVNPSQARALLTEVRKQKPSGPRLYAFFAVMYYAGLRPEEAVNLREHNIVLPPLVKDAETGEWVEPPEDENWGELHFSTAAPDIGSAWTDNGTQREHRGLKHRPVGTSRTVPCPPQLTTILRKHLSEIGTGPGKRIFWGTRGGELPTCTYHSAWNRTREKVFSPEDYASPLARRPYDLRHACVSTWLNGGVHPTQVAEWAGHSVDVLLRIYAKCLSGQYEAAKRRISAALKG